MNFEYAITVDEYIAACFLYHKLNGSRRRMLGVGWILAGLLFFVMASIERVPCNWTPAILAGVGAWGIYGGFRMLFPTRYFSLAYPAADLAGKRFKADVTADGLDVTGDLRSWHVRWPGMRLKGENERVFMFYSSGTMFIFGKEYLTNQQQRELRDFSGLTPIA
jgi:hypothetical protein